jgi:hypothetical protein
VSVGYWVLLCAGVFFVSFGVRGLVQLIDECRELAAVERQRLAEWDDEGVAA